MVPSVSEEARGGTFGADGSASEESEMTDGGVVGRSPETE